MKNIGWFWLLFKILKILIFLYEQELCFLADNP